MQPPPQKRGPMGEGMGSSPSPPNKMGPMGGGQHPKLGPRPYRETPPPPKKGVP